MPARTATAGAHPNIAFIKYWGNKDHDLRIPANGSLSMNLAGLETRTQVTFDLHLKSDRLTINGKLQTGHTLTRVRLVLERVRQLAGIREYAEVISENNFPSSVGIASSASAFAALAMAASAAADLPLEESNLSRLARRGSGSACRSVPGGFVEWAAGDSDENSFAFSIAPPHHWELSDCIAVISQEHKETGSSVGHRLADTSPFQASRVSTASERLERCRQALFDRDFENLAEVMELDSDMMHAVMITSSPPLLYWQPATVAVIHAVRGWRREGLQACYTIDAGPNVHVLCPSYLATDVKNRLQEIPGVLEVIVASPGGPAWLV
ncbi:MAG: diphosphomevalonate decarboxylase [Chloroflexota bacterium]